MKLLTVDLPTLMSIQSNEYLRHTLYDGQAGTSILCIVPIVLLPFSVTVVISAGVFTFGPKKEVKPGAVPFDLAASLKKKSKSYTPYKGKEGYINCGLHTFY